VEWRAPVASRGGRWHRRGKKEEGEKGEEEEYGGVGGVEAMGLKGMRRGTFRGVEVRMGER